MRAHGIETYDELIRRSIEDIGWFWDAVIDDLDIEFFQPYAEVFDTRSGVEWTTWFTGGVLNLAHQCVDRWASRTPDAPAVLGEGEDGSVRTWSRRPLTTTAACSWSMRRRVSARSWL